MKVISWNVNGIRSATKKGFLEWLHNSDADIVGLQEVRAFQEQIDPQVAKPQGWHSHFASAKRPGYSGVGIFGRFAPEHVETSLAMPDFDIEGRVQLAYYGSLLVANVYFPNGNGKERDNSRVPYKLAFYQRLFDVLESEKKKGRPILIIGDFNTAHTEIDLARPKENVNTSGFLLEEREELDRWLKEGYVDTFRCFEKGMGHYTWWSQRAQSRKRNVGWRIDYVLASEAAMPYLKHAFILPEIQGSDHCPIGVEIDNSVLRA